MLVRGCGCVSGTVNPFFGEKPGAKALGVFIERAGGGDLSGAAGAPPKSDVGNNPSESSADDTVARLPGRTVQAGKVRMKERQANSRIFPTNGGELAVWKGKPKTANGVKRGRLKAGQRRRPEVGDQRGGGRSSVIGAAGRTARRDHSRRHAR